MSLSSREYKKDKIWLVRDGQTTPVSDEEIKAKGYSPDKAPPTGYRWIANQSLRTRKSGILHKDKKRAHEKERDARPGYIDTRYSHDISKFIDAENINIDNPKTYPVNTKREHLVKTTYGEARALSKKVRVWVIRGTTKIVGIIDSMDPEKIPDGYKRSQLEIKAKNTVEKKKSAERKIWVFFDEKEAKYVEVAHGADIPENAIEMVRRDFKNIMNPTDTREVWANIKTCRHYYEKNAIDLDDPSTLKKIRVKKEDVELMLLKDFLNLKVSRKEIWVSVLDNGLYEKLANKEDSTERKLKKLYGDAIHIKCVSYSAYISNNHNKREIKAIKNEDGTYRRATGSEDDKAIEMTNLQFKQKNARLKKEVIDIETREVIPDADPENPGEGQRTIKHLARLQFIHRKNRKARQQEQKSDLDGDDDMGSPEDDVPEQAKPTSLKTASAKRKRTNKEDEDANFVLDDKKAAKQVQAADKSVRRLIPKKAAAAAAAAGASVLPAVASEQPRVSAATKDPNENQSLPRKKLKIIKITQDISKAVGEGKAYGIQVAALFKDAFTQHDEHFKSARNNWGDGFNQYYAGFIEGFKQEQSRLSVVVKRKGEERAMADYHSRDYPAKFRPTDKTGLVYQEQFGVFFVDFYAAYTQHFDMLWTASAKRFGRIQGGKDAYRCLEMRDEKSIQQDFEADLAAQGILYQYPEDAKTYFPAYMSAYREAYQKHAVVFNNNLSVKSARDATDCMKSPIERQCAEDKARCGWSAQVDCVFPAHPEAKTDFAEILGVQYKAGYLPFQEEKLAIVRSEAINQRGVKSRANMYYPVGTPLERRILCEYAGVFCDNRYKPDLDSRHYLLKFTKQDGKVQEIDAVNEGNVGRFFNHASKEAANCEYVSIYDRVYGDRVVIAVKTGYFIKAGVTELTCEYMDAPANTKQLNAAPIAVSTQKRPAAAAASTPEPSVMELLIRSQQRNGFLQPALPAGTEVQAKLQEVLAKLNRKN